MSSFQDEQRVSQRGPFSAWRQSYVGEWDTSRSVESQAAACEVELIVRDFLESDEVEVEDITVIVCYDLEQRENGAVGVYTIGVIVRGYPLGLAEDELVSWAPTVESMVHQLTFSEKLSVRSQVDMLDAFAMVKEIFDEDKTAVYVQQFFKSSLCKSVGARVLWKRAPVADGFRKSRRWVVVDNGQEAQSNERKRLFQDIDDRLAKKAKICRGVSSL